MKNEIPKVLWMLWFQGWENAPTLVKKCKETWVKHNPDWTIHFLTSENISDFIDLEAIIPGYNTKDIRPESLSNVIRMALLLKYGGVWADSTLYCNKPLDSWLPEQTSSSSFFAFANPGPDRLLSNWFLAATPNHPIIQKWYDATVNYWDGRLERHTYFWCHYLFGELYQTDPELKNLWDKTPKVSADAPHYFLPYEKTFSRALTVQDKEVIDNPNTPVFKLTYRYAEEEITNRSALHYLLSDKRSTWESPIIIVGMHRSGTSLTASLMQQSGLDIGTALMGSATGNTNGHYENLDFYHFHMRMLEQLKYNADGWDEVEISKLETAYEEDAKNIIAENQSALWGWKDPRTTLFLNVWAKLLPNAKFLFVFRSPVEVIDSLYRRGTDEVIMNQPEKAIAVWIHYNKLVLKYYQQYKERSLLLNIESIIHDYAVCIKIINQKFDVNLNPDVNNLFDKKLFNETEVVNTSKRELLYHYKPEAQQIYDQLIHQSSIPSNGSSQHVEVKDSEQFSEEYFFTHWKDSSVQKTQQKRASNQLLQEHKNILDEKEQAIQNQQEKLNWMQKSKFWKIRVVWEKVKSLARK